MNSRIIKISGYNSIWPCLFQTENKLLSNALENIALNISHIGSTSVVGLPAKPIIDILIEVTDVTLLDDRSDTMQKLGYEVKGEFGIPGRRYFRKGGTERTHHIHAYNTGDAHLIQHLAFRDYLSVHPEVMESYGALKLRVVENCNNDIDKYMAGKNEFIQHHVKLAIDWYHSQQ